MLDIVQIIEGNIVPVPRTPQSKYSQSVLSVSLLQRRQEWKGRDVVLAITSVLLLYEETSHACSVWLF